MLCLVALGTLLWQTGQTDPGRIWILVLITAAAFAIELAFRLVSGRN